jgi:hypothetical protein
MTFSCDQLEALYRTLTLPNEKANQRIRFSRAQDTHSSHTSDHFRSLYTVRFYSSTSLSRLEYVFCLRLSEPRNSIRIPLLSCDSWIRYRISTYGHLHLGRLLAAITSPF